MPQRFNVRHRRHRSTLILIVFLLVILGCTSFYILSWDVQSEDVLETTNTQKSPPKPASPDTPPRLAIFLLSADNEKSRKRLEGMYHAWIRYAQAIPAHLGTVTVFLAVGTGDVNPFRTSVIASLPVVNVPPTDYDHIYKKTFLGYRRMYEEHLEEYDWFMKADDDTFVRLVPLLKHLSRWRKMQKEEQRLGWDWWYLGHQGPFNSERFTYSGPGYIISQSLLYALGPHIPSWLKEPTPWEDVAFYQHMVKSLPQNDRRWKGAGLEMGCQDVSKPGFNGWSSQMHVDRDAKSTWERIIHGEVSEVKNVYTGVQGKVEEVVTWHSVDVDVVGRLSEKFRGDYNFTASLHNQPI